MTGNNPLITDQDTETWDNIRDTLHALCELTTSGDMTDTNVRCGVQLMFWTVLDAVSAIRKGGAA